MAGPYVIPLPSVLMLLGAALVFAVSSFLKRYRWDEGTLYQKFTLTAGALAFLILLTPLQELDTSRPDNPRGMLLVGIAALILLVLLKRRIKQYKLS